MYPLAQKLDADVVVLCNIISIRGPSHIFTAVTFVTAAAIDID